jgi:hypothetical protein
VPMTVRSLLKDGMRWFLRWDAELDTSDCSRAPVTTVTSL